MSTPSPADPTLWDQMMAQGQAERQRITNGRAVIDRDELPVELTPFGRLRWYTHPSLDAPNTRAIYFCELEIPEGSRSGRIRHQGDIVHFVVAGDGYTELDGQVHQWEARDLIGIPPRPHGVVFQHVNTGRGAVRMVMALANLDSALGAHRGVALEVLSPAPEFAAAATDGGGSSGPVANASS